MLRTLKTQDAVKAVKDGSRKKPALIYPTDQWSGWVENGRIFLKSHSKVAEASLFDFPIPEGESKILFHDNKTKAYAYQRVRPKSCPVRIYLYDRNLSEKILFRNNVRSPLTLRGQHTSMHDDRISAVPLTMEGAQVTLGHYEEGRSDDSWIQHWSLDNYQGPWVVVVEAKYLGNGEIRSGVGQIDVWGEPAKYPQEILAALTNTLEEVRTTFRYSAPEFQTGPIVSSAFASSR